MRPVELLECFIFATLEGRLYGQSVWETQQIQRSIDADISVHY